MLLVAVVVDDDDGDDDDDDDDGVVSCFFRRTLEVTGLDDFRPLVDVADFATLVRISRNN